MSKNIKFGLCLPIRIDTDAGFCVDLAVRAEALGFDSVWASDHTVIPSSRVGRFSRVFHDPFVLLSAAAVRTTSIKVGLSVLIAPYRNPLIAAKSVATLDEVSKGRALLGVGAGWMKREFDILGAEFERRGAYTDEAIDVFRELWGSDTPEFSGEFTEFSDIAFYPKPVSGGKLPIYVGGNGEKSAARAAQKGDGWQPTGISPAGYAEKSAFIKNAVKGRGDFVFSVRNRVSFGSESAKGSMYTFSGDADNVCREVEKFSESGVTLVLFDPEADTTEGITEIVETLGSSVLPRFR